MNNIDVNELFAAATVLAKLQPPEPKSWTGQIVMVRSADSGVHYGKLANKKGTEVLLVNARRVWAWAGAATLSELATRGTNKPNDCKLPAPIPEILVLGVCEVIPMTDKAIESLSKVPIWTAAK